MLAMGKSEKILNKGTFKKMLDYQQVAAVLNYQQPITKKWARQFCNTQELIPEELWSPDARRLYVACLEKLAS